MKTYILVARHLGKVSGEKIYHYNKMRYMLSLGWRVIFLSGKEETTPFDSNEHYSNLVFPALTYAPECYPRREVKKTVDDVAAAIGEPGDERCIIESDAVNRAVWGELIAKRLGAKHMVFLLQERHPYDEDIRAFLRFKYDRHELAGITVHSMNQIFADEHMEPRADAKIAACCQNSVEECEDLISDQIPKGAALTFGSIGRLDKGCVPAILKGFRAYAAAHPGEKYNLVLIGGATGRKRLRQILQEMKACDTIHTIITGYLYPIPASLLRNIDVFVSTAGSATVSYRFHRPTVIVHPSTGEPCGVLGLGESGAKTMYDPLPDTSLEACIESALAHADEINYVYNGYEDYTQRMNIEFARQLSIAETAAQKEYYDEARLMKIRTTHIKGHTVHWLVGHTIGAAGLNRFVSAYKIVRREGR